MTTRKVTLEDFGKDKTLSEHARRSKEVARALDAKAGALPYARTFTSVEFQEFVAELTPKRFELLRLAIKRRRSIGDLATTSHRDQSAVTRDVARLQKLGLVKVETVANPGRGQMKIVTPVATRVAIDATSRQPKAPNREAFVHHHEARSLRRPCTNALRSRSADWRDRTNYRIR